MGSRAPELTHSAETVAERLAGRAGGLRGLVAAQGRGAALRVE